MFLIFFIFIFRLSASCRDLPSYSKDIHMFGLVQRAQQTNKPAGVSVRGGAPAADGSGLRRHGLSFLLGALWTRRKLTTAPGLPEVESDNEGDLVFGCQITESKCGLGFLMPTLRGLRRISWRTSKPIQFVRPLGAARIVSPVAL